MNETLCIHSTAEVHSSKIGQHSTIMQFCIILENAKIGKNANISSNCLIENEVSIGDKTSIGNGVHIPDGTTIGNNVVIGANVTFANNKLTEQKKLSIQLSRTVVEDDASIGGGATVISGITIGKGSVVAAGAVVTKSVPAYTIVKGNPARVSGYASGSSHAEGVAPNLIKINDVPSRGDQESVTLGVGNALLKRLKFVEDMRGNLSVSEFPDDIPFTPKRYFLVFDVPNQEVRGSHAHKECEQFLICVKGSVNIMVDDGNLRSEVVLDSPDLGVYIPPLVWGTQYRYSNDAVLLVFASHHYDDGDYIRSYQEFQNTVKSNQP